jgi:hypothetical protein
MGSAPAGLAPTAAETLLAAGPECIEKIVVHAPDKSSGHRKQKVEIYYNCVGIIAVPDEDAWVAAIMECKRGRKPKESKTA